MITRNALGAAALATTCLTPLAAFADDFNLGPATPATGAAAPAASGSTVGGMPFWGYIDLGVMGQVGNNPNQAGRYTGLNTNGIDAYGDFSLTARAPWNSDSSRYYNFTGDNLVFQTGSHLGTGLGADGGWSGTTANSIINEGDLGFKVGDQGVWGVNAYYRAVTYTGNVIDSIYTVNGANAYLNQPLGNFGGGLTASQCAANPAYCVGGQATKYYYIGAISSASSATAISQPAIAPAGLAALEAADQGVQVGTRRDIFGTDFKYQTGPWTFSGNIRHEHKEGSLEESFDGALDTPFALPIDFDTDRYDATAAYNTRNFQGSFSYTLSHFVDNIGFVNLPYPIVNAGLSKTTSGLAVSASPAQLSSAYSLPPSNDAHYLTLMLADNNLIPNTRLNLNARYGWELQNDQNPPSNADPALGQGAFTAAQEQGVTNSSPNIVASVFQAKASASSHPLTNTDARVYYGIDTRNVSLDDFAVGPVGANSGADTALASTYYVVPQTWVKQDAGVDLGYMVLPESGTKVTVGYRFDDTDRSNAQVSHSHTDTGSIAVLSKLPYNLDGKLSFDYSDRSGVLNYMEAWSNLEGKYDDDAWSGAYFQAPMTSEGVTGRLDYNAWKNLAGEIFVQFKNENYTYPSEYNGSNCADGTCEPASTSGYTRLGVGQGVKQDYALVVGPDVTYRPTKDINLHAFYTFEEIFWVTTGNGECSTIATATTAVCGGTATSYGGAGYFSNTYDSSTHTVGVSGDWKVNQKLKLKAEYTVSYGSVMFTQFNGVWVPTPTAIYQNVSNYPDIDSFMNNLKLTGTYEIVPNVDLVVSGALMTFRNNDWNYTTAAVQNSNSGGVATNVVSLLSPGYPAPNYAVGQLMAGVKFKF